MDLVMLICASVAALGFGIFVAYAIMKVGFALMRSKRPVATVKPEPETARLS